MEPKIIFEDEAVLIIDKPSGWITNGSETTSDQPVVQKWLYSNFKYQISKDHELRSGIVHRLDKETSGLLIVAKTENSFSFIQNHFKLRLIEKEYIALAHGKIEPKDGDVEVTVGRLPWSRKKFGVIPGGRESKTSYSLKAYYKNDMGVLSLLSLKPKTGRTHQIRIHLKYLGHPIVSDPLYAGRKTFRSDRKWCPRLFLHASNISFTHPLTGKSVGMKSEIPTDLNNCLSLLEKISDRT